MAEILHIHIISIIALSLIIRYEKVFGQDKIRIGQFFAAGEYLLPSAHA